MQRLSKKMAEVLLYIARTGGSQTRVTASKEYAGLLSRGLIEETEEGVRLTQAGQEAVAWLMEWRPSD